MKVCIERILELLGTNGVDVLIDSVFTLFLILIYCKQIKLQREQTKIQATATNIDAADRLQKLYDAFYELYRFLLGSRNELLSATLVNNWNNTDRLNLFNSLCERFVLEVSKVDFFVSKGTLVELRDYEQFSHKYYSEMIDLHIVVLPSYRELGGDYDDVYRTFQDSECEASVRSFMEDLSMIDKDYKEAYMSFADSNDLFESKSTVLLNKFKAKEGIGSII